MRNLLILIVLASAGLSCIQQKSPKNASVDEHTGVDMHPITLFTDSTEFYVEFSPLREGQETEFLVHLTGLSHYKPYSTGSVRVSLELGGEKISASADQPEIPGIWHLELSPRKSGEGRIEFEFSSGDFSEKTGFFHGHVEALNGDENEEASEHEDEGHSPEGIRFSKEQAWKSDFAVSLLKSSPFSGIIKAGGEILPMPGEKYFIHARTSGIVNYLKKDLVAGGDIRKGEDMMSIEGQDLAEGNIAIDFANAETRFLRSRGEYERRLILFRENALSEKQFIETRSAYISDSLRYYNLLQSYAAGGLKISSPITGHIHELKVSQGEFVEAGQIIATVSSDRRLLLRADVSQQHYSRIGDIVSTNIRTSYHKKVIDFQALNGRLLAIGSSVKENNQYLPVYFEAENNGELLEGAYAEFFLKTRATENCILVPVQSLLEEQGRYYVFVQTSGETYQKREVTTGESDGFQTRVMSGLSEGERLVTKGSMLLKSASMSSSIPADSHQH